MTTYLLKRIALLVPTLLGIILLNFIIVQFAPGGPVENTIAKLQGISVSSTERISGSNIDGTQLQIENVSNENIYVGAQGLDPEIVREIEKICKKYNVELDKLSPRLTNTLDIPQNAISNLSVEIERYTIELLIRGNFLNIGRLINELSEKNYLINSMEINSNKNDDQVDASLDLFVYRSKPNLKVHDNSISIEKINSSIPKVPNEALPNNLKWKNDIFSESRLSNKKGGLKNQKSFKKEYLLTQIILSKPLGAIINNNLHPIGSKIGPYTVSKISENTVVLSGKRKSIVLELEIDEDQFVYSLEGFKKAFSNARKKNQTTFIYKGKLYSTRLDD